jgi:hypothetical protein
MCADAYDAEPAREPSPTPAPRLVVLICHSTLLATSHVCPSSPILCLSMGSGQCTVATVAGFFLFAAGRHSFVLCVKPTEPASTPRRTSWSPPLPGQNDWQALAWYAHFHRHKLRQDQQERVADFLLGVAFYDTDGRCERWHLEELRSLVAIVQRCDRHG